MNGQKSALVIGLGSIGERHLRCFQASGEFVVAGCDVNRELGKAIGDRYGCPVYDGLDAALAAGSYDAAVICTLANSHIPLAIRCVEQGLHVLIEKPLAVDMEGVEELQKLALSTGRVVRVAYTTRALPMARELRQMVDDGIIGDIRHASSVCGQHFPTFRPSYREIYYRSHELGGGAIQDALTHQVHTLEWLIGPLSRVFAASGHLVLADVEVEDTVNVCATSRDGALVGFAFNQFQAPNEATIQLNGTKGSHRWEFHKRRIGTYLHGDTDWEWVEHPTEDRDQPYIRQAIYFRNELDGKNSALATLDEGLQTLKVNLAALKSARERREVLIS